MAETYEINLRIHHESELYSPYDERNRTLHPKVIEYLYYRYLENSGHEKPLLHVTSDEPIDRDQLLEALQRHIVYQRTQLDREVRKNSLKQFWMLVLGFLFFGFSLYMRGRIPAFPKEIISTIGAISIWEAVRVWIVDNPAIGVKRKWLDYLSQPQVICDVIPK